MRGTNERMGGKPQAQENESKLIQARKTLELRIEVLVDAMTGCHMAVATRKTRKEIEASMDAVEIAWDKIGRTRVEFGSDAGLNFDHLPMMVEMVLTKATKYLAKAQAKMEKWWEAQVQALEAEKATEVSEMNEVAPEVSEMNEVAPEVSEMNEVAPEVSAVNKMNEVAPEVKEEMSEGKPLEVMRRGSFAAKPNVRTSWEPGESPVAKLEEVKFDVNTEAMEGSSVQEVMQSDGLTMMKVTEQSRCANWDPGELVNVKEPIEMLDVEEVTILVNDDKVRLRGNVNLKALYDAMTLYSIVRFNVKAIVIVLFLSRFVNGFRRKCPIELSDYG